MIFSIKCLLSSSGGVKFTATANVKGEYVKQLSQLQDTIQNHLLKLKLIKQQYKSLIIGIIIKFAILLLCMIIFIKADILINIVAEIADINYTQQKSRMKIKDKQITRNLRVCYRKKRTSELMLNNSMKGSLSFKMINNFLRHAYYSMMVDFLENKQLAINNLTEKLDEAHMRSEKRMNCKSSDHSFFMNIKIFIWDCFYYWIMLFISIVTFIIMTALIIRNIIDFNDIYVSKMDISKMKETLHIAIENYKKNALEKKQNRIAARKAAYDEKKILEKKHRRTLIRIYKAALRREKDMIIRAQLESADKISI